MNEFVFICYKGFARWFVSVLLSQKYGNEVLSFAYREKKDMNATMQKNKKGQVIGTNDIGAYIHYCNIDFI